MTASQFDERRDKGITISAPMGAEIADYNYQFQKDMLDAYMRLGGFPQMMAASVMKTTTLMRTPAWADYMRILGAPAAALDQVLSGPSRDAPQMSTHYADMGKFTRQNRLVTHNMDGTLNRVFSADVRNMFKPGNERNWPHIILTSNHALCTNHLHISGIMRGFRKLAMDTFDKPVNVIRYPHEPLADREGTDDESRRTMIISAVDAEPNAFMNGAELISRLACLRREQEANAQRGQGDKALESEEHISPAAKRLAKFILRLLVENERDLPRVDPFASELVAKQDERRLEQSGQVVHNPFEAGSAVVDAQGREIEHHPIVLRADAQIIAQHIKLAGYSKGGNTVSDAMRYLLKELRQTKMDGQPLFYIRDAQKADRVHPMDKPHIAALMRNLGVLCVATGEVPLTMEEKEYGIRRLNIINENDLIANHFRSGDQHRYGTHDDFLEIEGAREHLGHGPKEALGFYEDEGENSKGALIQDKEVYNRLRGFFASMFDKVAVSDIVIIPEHGGHKPEIEIELAPGAATNDHLIKEHVGRLIDRLGKAVHGVSSQKLSFYTDLETRSLRIRGWDDGTPLNREVVEALKTAFEDLQRTPNNNIVISNNIFRTIEEYLEQGVERRPGDGRPALYAERILQDRPHDIGRIRSEGQAKGRYVVGGGSGSSATGRV